MDHKLISHYFNELELQKDECQFKKSFASLLRNIFPLMSSKDSIYISKCINDRTWISAQGQGSPLVLEFMRTMFVVLRRNILSEKKYLENGGNSAFMIILYKLLSFC